MRMNADSAEAACDLLPEIDTPRLVDIDGAVSLSFGRPNLGHQFSTPIHA